MKGKSWGRVSLQNNLNIQDNCRQLNLKVEGSALPRSAIKSKMIKVLVRVRSKKLKTKNLIQVHSSSDYWMPTLIMMYRQEIISLLYQDNAYIQSILMKIGQ
jgi:hypothetical protein